jgi:hypothetical protein
MGKRGYAFAYRIGLGLHGIMQTLHEAIGILRSHPPRVRAHLPPHPLTRLPRRRRGLSGKRPPSSASPPPCVCMYPLPLFLSRGLGSSLSPYCPCTTGLFKSRNLYKPVYFETLTTASQHSVWSTVNGRFRSFVEMEL